MHTFGLKPGSAEAVRPCSVPNHQHIRVTYDNKSLLVNATISQDSYYISMLEEMFSRCCYMDLTARRHILVHDNNPKQR